MTVLSQTLQPVVESVVEIINMPATTPLDTIVPVSFHFTQCMEQTQCLEQHPLYLQISLYGCRKESLNECDTTIPPLTVAPHLPTTQTTKCKTFESHYPMFQVYFQPESWQLLNQVQRTDLEELRTINSNHFK